jgi:hypothetical protein
MSPAAPTPQRSPAWRARFRQQFLKTKMCRFYEAGLCRYGEDCPYAHSEQDLSVVPDLKKTSLCDAWKRGACPRSSDQCPFAHGDEELCLTPAFVEKPLSKRIRALSESQQSLDPALPLPGPGSGGGNGLRRPSSDSGCGSNPQEAERWCIEEVTAPPGAAAPPPPELQQGNPKAFGEEGHNSGASPTAGRLRRQQRKSRNNGSQGGGLCVLTQSNVQEAPWIGDASCRMPPALPLGSVQHGLTVGLELADGGVGTGAQWQPTAATFQLPLMPAMFDQASPEKVAEMLRMAMPEYYED